MKNTYDLTEDVVVLSNIVEMDGSLSAGTSNKILIFLANMQKDTMPIQKQTRQGFGQRIVMKTTPVYLNLSIVIAANFTAKNYSESLKFISSVITYFQSNNIFDKNNSPNLDARIEKLLLEIENLQPQELQNLWSMFGGKYIPSIVYKVRTVILDPNTPYDQSALINQTTIDIDQE